MTLKRVQKLISEAGYCSRRKAETLISQNKVTVNDTPITLGDKADPESDTISIDGTLLHFEKKAYLMLHKPVGYITSVSNREGRKTVMDIIHHNTRLYPVGRLDRDATGLLLLTNDGDFANRITHPSSEVQKTYIAVLTEPFRKDNLKKLRGGISLEGRLVKADQAVILADDTVAVSIHIGLNKVVKRLFKACGYYIKHLHRTHIGSLALDIHKGETRPLTEDDKKAIFTPLTLDEDIFL